MSDQIDNMPPQGAKNNTTDGQIESIDSQHFIQQTQLNDRKEEKEHLEKVCDSFRQYATFTRCARAGQAARLSELSPSMRKFLPRSMIAGNEEFKLREEVMQVGIAYFNF